MPLLPAESIGSTPSALLAVRIAELRRQTLRERFWSRGIAVVMWDPILGTDGTLQAIGAFRRHARVRSRR